MSVQKVQVRPYNLFAPWNTTKLRYPTGDVINSQQGTRKHFFVDEAKNFDFSLREGASKYFILTSVTIGDCEVADRLLNLRRELS